VVPRFGALHWPGYATLVLDDEIDGEAVVIQLRKGWNPAIPGVGSSRARVGAEVGVYRRMPGSLRLRSLPLLPRTLDQFVVGAVGTCTDLEASAVKLGASGATSGL
jgi:hypothetical protein